MIACLKISPDILKEKIKGKGSKRACLSSLIFKVNPQP
jgi:hypothetical protein